ncbi:hypothetical protein AGR1A_pAt10030 [Agrobacterium fabacearum CFBP 5771]|nr:hypothetical protein AGR1A_pAt10030 [Agrobacterium fabacearum CFBP 5771]
MKNVFMEPVATEPTAVGTSEDDGRHFSAIADGVEPIWSERRTLWQRWLPVRDWLRRRGSAYEVELPVTLMPAGAGTTLDEGAELAVAA